MEPEHIAHLQNLAYGGLMRSTTPDDVAEQLVQQGYARRAVGGLIATAAAHQLLAAKGFKPKTWQ